MPRTSDHELLRRLGARVRALRDAAGLTQQALADATGMEPANISRIERGSLGVSIRSLVDLAGALGVQPSAVISALDDTGALIAEPPPIPPATAQELRLLAGFRRLDSVGRRAVAGLVITLAERDAG